MNANKISNLSCCRPTYRSTFGYYVETPTLVDVAFYRLKYQGKQKCDLHNRLSDHNTNEFNACTDLRAWSHSPSQRTAHFLDIVNGKVPLCAPEAGDGERRSHPSQENSIIRGSDEIPIEEPVKTVTREWRGKDKNGAPPESKSVDVEQAKVTGEGSQKDKNGAPPASQQVDDEQAKVTKEEEAQGEQITMKDNTSVDVIEIAERRIDELVKGKTEEQAVLEKQLEKPTHEENHDLILFTDNIIMDIENNLGALDETFCTFVRKNHDFVLNLVELLGFEKQKQKSLEKEYNQLKQENNALQIQNEYLKSVNENQTRLFKQELDKVTRESNAMSTQAVSEKCKMEKDKYAKRMEKANLEKTRLHDEVQNLKNSRAVLFQHYFEVLQLLEEIQHLLSMKTNSDRDINLSSSLQTIGDCGDRTVTDVLLVALNNGIQCLNVRDLSILHDAIEERHSHMCHNYGLCRVSSTPDLSISMTYTQVRIGEYPEHDTLCQGLLDEYKTTSSSLSFIPSRECPTD